MCTFNGARFIAEQLRSLADQTRLPDELVVFDDGSTDGTWDTLAKFATTAPFPVRLHRQPHNKGYVKNFRDAINACGSSIVFLCDQDDVWLSDKIATMMAAFEGNPGTAMAFTDATLVDAGLAPLGRSQWQAVGFSPSRQRLFLADPFAVLSRQHVVTGAACAFRSSLASTLDAISPGWFHDAWLALACTMLADTPVPLSQKALLYRQHGGNQIGAPPSSWKARLGKMQKRLTSAGRIDQMRELQKRWEGVLHWRTSQPNLPWRVSESRVQAVVDYYKMRAALPPRRIDRVRPVARAMVRGDYRNAAGKRALMPPLGDIVFR
jgi:glycosyltransferase involved in cell wall biosynthesis